MSYQDRFAACEPFVRALAAELGWSYSHNPEHWLAEISRVDGLTITVDPRDKPGRVVLKAKVPCRTPAGEHVGHDTAPEITVSTTRPVTAVAADVRRRLLAAAESAHLKGLANVAERIATHYMGRTVCAQLGITPDVARHTGSRWIDVGDGYVQVLVQDGGSVRIEARGINAELAVELVKLLEAHASEKAA